MTSPNEPLYLEIASLYTWIDQALASHTDQAGQCSACGQCCDFISYGHRLYVTDAEMRYFTHMIGHDHIRTMSSNQCPYMIDNRCSVHKIRFSGCRIFCCQGDQSYQNDLSEQVITKLKYLSDEHAIPYLYRDLRESLNNIFTSE